MIALIFQDPKSRSRLGGTVVQQHVISCSCPSSTYHQPPSFFPLRVDWSSEGLHTPTVAKRCTCIMSSAHWLRGPVPSQAPSCRRLESTPRSFPPGLLRGGAGRAAAPYGSAILSGPHRWGRPETSVQRCNGLHQDSPKATQPRSCNEKPGSPQVSKQGLSLCVRVVTTIYCLP